MSPKTSDASEALPPVMGRQEGREAMLARWEGVEESKARLRQMKKMQREEVGF